MRRRLKVLLSMLLIIAMTIPHSAGSTMAAESTVETPVVIRTWCISDVAEGTDEQILTVSGSAISLGGNSSLADGIILITPEEGDTLQSIQTVTGDLNYLTVSSFKEGSVFQRLPEDIKNAIDINEDGYIIYISKSYYMNKLEHMDRFGQFDITINISSELGDLKEYTVNVKPGNYRYGVNELEPGSIYNPFEMIETLRDAASKLPANSTNWTMESRGASMENTVFDISDGTDGKQFGEMLIKDYGSRSLYIKSEVDGRDWEIFFNVRLSADQPLSKVSVNANEEEFTWQPYDPSKHISIPYYVLQPQEGSNLAVYNDVGLTLETLSGAVINWSESRYNGKNLIENGILSFDDETYFEGVAISNLIEIQTNTEKQTIHIKADGNIEGDILDLVITKGDKTYIYQLLFSRNTNMSIRMKYMESFCVPLNQPVDMFEYFFFSDDIPKVKSMLLDGINSGQYRVNIAGAQNLYEDGIFTGKVKFVRPGFGAYIQDTKNNMSVTSGDLSVYMRNNYIISANDTLDLEASLNMNLQSDNHEVVVTGNSEAYQQNGFVITANEISESSSIEVRIKGKNNNNLLGIITIKIVGTNDDFEKVIEEAVEAIPGVGNDIDEVSVLNVNINTVSKSIFNRLINKNGYMSLLNKNVVWTFDGQNISVNKAKDVDLDVQVGTVLDETAKTEILRLIDEADADSVLVDFPENGELPGPASMKINLTTEQVNSLKKQDGIYLYYFNKVTNQLEKEDTDIIVEQDYNGNYYMQFTVRHNSDFVLSSDNSLGSIVINPQEPEEPAPEEPEVPTPQEPEEPTPGVPSNPTPVVPSHPTPSVPIVSPTPVPEQEKSEDTVEFKTDEGTINASITAVESEEEVKVSLELPKDILETIGDSEKDEVLIPVSTQEITKFIAKSKTVDVSIAVTAPKKLLEEGRRANINLNTDLLETIKTEMKDLTVCVKDETGNSLYEWSIAGSDLIKTDKKIKDINLSLSTKQVRDIADIKKLIDQKNSGIVIDFKHNGILPVQANVKVYVGDITGRKSQTGIKSNKKVYVYHYNNSTNKLETLPYSSGYKVDKDGYLELKLLHCSEYVILPKEADSKTYTSLRNQISVDVKNKTLAPKKTARLEVKLPYTLEMVNNKKDKPSQSAKGIVTVTYASNNEEVAIVDENGKITARKSGSAIITTKLTLYSGKIKTVRTKIIVK